MTTPDSSPPTEFVCTADDPYTREKAAPFGGRSAHPDAKLIGTSSDWFDGDDEDTYHCPNCNTTFTVLVPR